MNKASARMPFSYQQESRRGCQALGTHSTGFPPDRPPMTFDELMEVAKSPGFLGGKIPAPPLRCITSATDDGSCAVQKAKGVKQPFPAMVPESLIASGIFSRKNCESPKGGSPISPTESNATPSKSGMRTRPSLPTAMPRLFTPVTELTRDDLSRSLCHPVACDHEKACGAMLALPDRA